MSQSLAQVRKWLVWLAVALLGLLLARKRDYQEIVHALVLTHLQPR